MDQAFETTVLTEGRDESRVREMRDSRRSMRPAGRVSVEESGDEDGEVDEVEGMMERFAAMFAEVNGPARGSDGGEIWGPGSRSCVGDPA